MTLLNGLCGSKSRHVFQGKHKTRTVRRKALEETEILASDFGVQFINLSDCETRPTMFPRKT